MKKILVLYRNWKGKIEWRNIQPLSVWWGSDEWHADMQWLMRVFDCDKGETRTFAMKDILLWHYD